MKVWLVNLSQGTLNILNMLDELECEVQVMYDISNHTPQWLSCSDEAFTKLKLVHPELILVVFDANEFETEANKALSTSCTPWLSKYSCLAMKYI